MHFLLILAVLATLVSSESAGSEPISYPGFRLLLVIAGMLLAPSAAWVASASLADRLRQGPFQRHAVLGALAVVRRLHAGLWLVVAGVTVWGLGWPRLVRCNWHLRGSLLLDDLLILVPVLLPLVLSWAAFYEVDRELRRDPAAGDDAAGPPTRCRYLLLHVRHDLGLVLVPVFALLAVQDAGELAMPGLRKTPPGVALQVCVLLLLILLLPAILRRLWTTRPLPAGPLRTRLEQAARRAGFRARDILVWHSDGMIVNAAVTGFLPWLRYVFLSDGLLAQLSEEEVRAVFGHEMGHLRHRHLPLRVSAMLAPVSLWLLVCQIAPPVVEQVTGTVISGGLHNATQVGLLALMAMASYVLLVFGPYCRLLEGQADLFGCRSLAWESPPQPIGTFIDALENLARTSGIDRNARSWQHASIARRVEFLKRVAEDPDYEVEFQRRVRSLSALILAVLVSPLAWQLLMLAQRHAGTIQ